MGLFKSIKKAFKKIARGVKKVFKKVGKVIGKILGSKIGKILMAVLTVVTLGTALVAGYTAFSAGMAAGQSFFSAAVTGGKAFMGSLIGKPVEGGVTGATAPLDTATAQGIMNPVTQAAEAAGPLDAVASAGIMGTAPITPVPTTPAPTGGVVPPAPTAGVTPPPATGGFLSKAVDFLKTPSGTNIAGNIISGYASGKAAEAEAERTVKEEKRRQSLWADYEVEGDGRQASTQAAPIDQSLFDRVQQQRDSRGLLPEYAG